MWRNQRDTWLQNLKTKPLDWPMLGRLFVEYLSVIRPLAYVDEKGSETYYSLWKVPVRVTDSLRRNAHHPKVLAWAFGLVIPAIVQTRRALLHSSDKEQQWLDRLQVVSRLGLCLTLKNFRVLEARQSCPLSSRHKSRHQKFSHSSSVGPRNKRTALSGTIFK